MSSWPDVLPAPHAGYDCPSSSSSSVSTPVSPSNEADSPNLNPQGGENSFLCYPAIDGGIRKTSQTNRHPTRRWLLPLHTCTHPPSTHNTHTYTHTHICARRDFIYVHICLTSILLLQVSRTHQRRFACNMQDAFSWDSAH